jgi:hypothetical protein
MLVEERPAKVFNPGVAEKCAAGLVDSDAEICGDTACPKHSMQHETLSQTVPHAQTAMDPTNSLRGASADQARFLRRHDPPRGPPFVIPQHLSKRTPPDLDLRDCRQDGSFDG